MFKPLTQLTPGSLFILTGLPGVGKSHLAASVRSAGTLWVLDTETAAHHMIGKPGVHTAIQAVQTLSLRQVLDGMTEVKKVGRPGDTLILDSISKLFQTMRGKAQTRAGADMDKKVALSFDEHASANRNMQAIYTGLGELKQAGFHVIVISHLTKDYRARGTALDDAGMKLLADGKILYEADAVLQVEVSDAGKRTVTPVMKAPRPAYLQLGVAQPATIATLYPAQVATTLDITAAVTRFYARYGESLGGTTWANVQSYLGMDDPEPTTVGGWIETAATIKTKLSEVPHAAE